MKKEVQQEVKVENKEVVAIAPKVDVELNNILKDIFEAEIKLDNLKVNFYRYNIDLFKSSSNHKELEKVLLKKVTEQGKINNATANHISKAKNIIKISSLSVTYDIYLFEGRSNNIKAYYYNIEKMIRLFEYLSLNYVESEALMVRKELNKLIKIKDKKEYNDTLAKSLTALFKKYKIVLSDGGDVVKVNLTNEGITNFLATLTPEQLDFVLKQANELKNQDK